jgi:glutaminyl-peptide cyclotransferase
MKLRYFLLVAILLASMLVVACGGSAAKPGPSSTEGSVDVLGSIPHAESAWTEGLVVSEGVLWESTGLQGKSEVRALDLQTGDVLWAIPNSEGFFGEGLVRAFGKTYLLSWTEGEAFVFDRNASKPYTLLARYDGEGWGLTATSNSLVNSNGSSTLYYRDPQTFAITKEVSIEFGGAPVEQLNELEYDGTYVWANQWQTHYIYRIRESNASEVTRFTLPPDICPDKSPNGIAWDEQDNLFYVTGQACDSIWKVRFQQP